MQVPGIIEDNAIGRLTKTIPLGSSQTENPIVRLTQTRILL